MVKLKFEVKTRPHSFDIEDEIEAIINDSGVQLDLERAVEEVLDRYLHRREVAVIADLEW